METQHALDDIDLATSNTSCRILVVSPSAVQATTLIRRIQALGGSTDSPPEEEIVNKYSEKKDLLSPDLVKIPWIIENKYYSADVHFAVHPMRGLAPYLLQNTPAVIFVWGSNEAYKHHIERISRDLGGHEPEISLAVRIKSPPDEVPAEPVEEEDGEEDNTSIDVFVSSFGFEYVDATMDITDHRQERIYDQQDDSDGVPNLPRVIDALSTIMWPSMKGRDRSMKHGKAQLRRDPSLLEWEADGSLPSVDDLVGTSSSQPAAQATRMKIEIDKLTKWLENDVQDGDREDPWRIAATSDALVASPREDDEEYLDDISTLGPRLEQTGTSELPDFARFDDDFTVFVSAPAAKGDDKGSGYATPVGNEFEYQDGLKPPRGLRSYNSLGSLSDFGGSDEGIRERKHVISDDEDEELPTQDEILETSTRIFGKRDKPSSAEDAQKIVFEENSRGEEVQLDEDDEYNMAPFDLTRVLGALQQMKEEISVMENEDERRKAAARVALGLVYGLEAEDD